jgi:hypothetical protein
MPAAPATFEAWLVETFGRAVTGESCPQFVYRDVMDWPAPVSDADALRYLTQVFEQPEDSLLYFSDRQIAAALWELGPGDAHCAFNPDILIQDRLRLVASVETFFRDFFDWRCAPALSHAALEHISPLNSACYMWWENIIMGGSEEAPYAARLYDKNLDVMEAVLCLPNPACKEAALHGLGHEVPRSDRARAIIERFLSSPAGVDLKLVQYASAASSGCIQ